MTKPIKNIKPIKKFNKSEWFCEYCGTSKKMLDFEYGTKIINVICPFCLSRGKIRNMKKVDSGMKGGQSK